MIKTILSDVIAKATVSKRKPALMLKSVRAVKRGKEGEKSSISTHLGVINAIVVQRNAALALSRRLESTS